MTDYSQCYKCGAEFSLEQADLVPFFCAMCGKPLEIPEVVPDD